MKKLVVLGAVLMLSSTASGELLFDPTEKAAPGRVEAGAIFGNSTTTYQISSNTGDQDRTYVGAYGAYRMWDGLDAVAAFSVVTKSQPEGASSSGDGSQFGLGLRGAIPVQAPVELIGYGQLRSISETAKNALGADVKASGTELSAGVFALAKAGQAITFFGGPEVILMENLESGGAEMSRDNTLGFRLGARSQIEGFNVVGQFAVAHETGFQLGLSRGF